MTNCQGGLLICTQTRFQLKGVYEMLKEVEVG